jgi:hypothetical protein
MCRSLMIVNEVNAVYISSIGSRAATMGTQCGIEYSKYYTPIGKSSVINQ